jgi:hypothetical protein
MKGSIATLMSKLVFLFFVLMNATIAFAQDGGGTGTGSNDGGTSVTVSKSSTSTSTATQDWYTAPWVWIVGAAVFILLLIALVRGNSSSKTDVHRTTVRKDVTSTE